MCFWSGPASDLYAPLWKITWILQGDDCNGTEIRLHIINIFIEKNGCLPLNAGKHPFWICIQKIAARLPTGFQRVSSSSCRRTPPLCSRTASTRRTDPGSGSGHRRTWPWRGCCVPQSSGRRQRRRRQPIPAPAPSMRGRRRGWGPRQRAGGSSCAASPHRQGRGCCACWSQRCGCRARRG